MVGSPRVSSEIRLSLNELRALLRRTYEALYHHGYDFAVMARSCLWLEAHGLDGIGLILRGLSDMETPCRDLKLTEISDTAFVLDGRGRCLIPFVNAAADLAIAGAQDLGFGKIDIVNVFGRLNIFAALKKAARLNLYAAAIWSDATDGRTHVLCLNSSEALPDYYILDQLHEGPWGQSGLSFICSTSVDAVSEIVRRTLPKNTKAYKTHMALAHAYAQALDTGIAVSLEDYKALNEIADRLLVPATEASRRGAGE